jgi:hypothetical protein
MATSRTVDISGMRLLLLVLALSAGCSEDPATDATPEGGANDSGLPNGPAPDARTSDALPGDAPFYAVCLADNSPTFANIESHLFAVSCAVGSNCHSTAEVALRGGGQLDLEGDVYVHLLGADGVGAPANNEEGSRRDLVRVKPGDPDNSLLFIKLRITNNTDRTYGSGMPYPTPGSVCPSTTALIRNWIAQGAPND